MAKNVSLATYKSKGSAGPLTYSNWKGIGYFKQKPTSVANPQTDGQVNQRARLALLVSLFSIIGGGVQTGFSEMAVKMSQFNAFMKFNIMTALDFVSVGVYTLNLANLKVAKGSLSPTPITALSINAPGDNITITYPNTVEAFNQSLADVARCVIYNSDTDTWTPNPTTSATRTDGTFTVAVKGGITSGDTIFAYLYFTSADSGKVSNSVDVSGVAA